MSDSPEAACLVGDRAHLEAVITACRELGGGWIEGAQLWQASQEMPYLLLLAQDSFRISRRAPVVILARDRASLEGALRTACSRLDDVTCAWIRLLEPETQSLVDQVLLSDATPKGRA